MVVTRTDHIGMRNELSSSFYIWPLTIPPYCISVRFSRHLGRAISMKTPRRPANTRNANWPSTMSHHHECSITRQGGKCVLSHVSGPPPGALESASSTAFSSSISLRSTAAAAAEKEDHHQYHNVPSRFATPSRPNVLGSIFTGVGS